MSYTYEFERPALAVDILVYSTNRSRTKVLLIKRKNEPFKGMWALPGGFVEVKELLIDAAARELFEETGLSLKKDLEFRGMVDTIDRDPRGRVISVVYDIHIPHSDVGSLPIKAGDDAEDIGWFDYFDLLEENPKLASDHLKIISHEFHSC